MPEIAKMTQLKTLKDLENELTISGDMRTLSHHQTIFLNLRQEAINWIKYISKDGFDKNIKIKTIEDITKKASIAIIKTETDLAVHWIKHFFNITKEDLE